MIEPYFVRNGIEVEQNAGSRGDRYETEQAAISRGYQGLMPFREQIALIRDLKEGNLSTVQAWDVAEQMLSQGEHCSDWLFADPKAGILLHVVTAGSTINELLRCAPVFGDKHDATVFSLEGLNLHDKTVYNPHHPVFQHFYGSGIPGLKPSIHLRPGWLPVNRSADSCDLIAVVHDNNAYSRGYILAREKTV